jgi:hypothetical protein
VLKTFWPKRSVTLPTVMPGAGQSLAASEELARIRAENDVLRQRLNALEEAVGREEARS